MHAYCPSTWEDEAGGFEGNLGYTMRLENQSKLIIFLNEEGRKGGRREKEGRKKRRREGEGGRREGGRKGGRGRERERET